MKLELKHITPYLPYGLNWHITPIGKNLEMLDCEKIHNLRIRLTDGSYDYYVDRMKPILRPLSDLNEDNAIFLSSDGYLAVCEECVYIDEMNYSDVEKLLERHYDVFNLIEQDLAIDIKKL